MPVTLIGCGRVTGADDWRARWQPVSTTSSSARSRPAARAARIRPSEPEHVVEAERALRTLDGVIAEQAAGAVAHDHVTVLAGRLHGRGAEQRRRLDQERAAAGDLDGLGGDLGAV